MAKTVVSNCVLCRKLRRKPLDQLMGQVPGLRVAAGFPPFSNTAMLMLGPLQLRLNRRTLQEAQVVIFTCTTTRAIHLELETNKSSEAFLMAFRRLACLHGHPNGCWRDCGSNFVGKPERAHAALGHSQDSKCYFGGICLRFRVAMGHPSRKPSERSCGVAYQIR